jgi:hypothetical protein
MHVLLDENLDWRLKPLFEASIEAITVTEHGWSGLKNGALLRAAQIEFDALLTMDRSLPYQQNVRAFDLGFVVVRAPSNRYADVAPLMSAINEALLSVRPGEVLYVADRS